ncbi:MAG: LL-diaminopimelate aminotransferase [Candidatus Sabulitectum sp.]|nr:LL-diaminopimelate aminotransferase [Candidatus Sabulitectum sp.]
MQKKPLISASERLSKLPPYLFAELDRQKKAARKRGLDLIDFGIGDPDMPTPDAIVKAGQDAVADPANHRYPNGAGCDSFREASRRWMKSQFGVECETAAVIGSKEGIAHIPMVFCNRGDLVLVPNPGYPVYRAAAILADAIPVDLPLLSENGFLPDLESIPPAVLREAKVMFLNYPNNPTGAVLTLEQMTGMVEFARKNNLLIVSDNSYSHIRFDGEQPMSFLQVPGAEDVVLEFHSLSKTFNMTGWRVGFVAGGAHLVNTFMGAKENIDSGAFTAVQKAAEFAMEMPHGLFNERMEVYRERRDILVEGLKNLNWDVFDSPGTFYVWVKLPRGADSMVFSRKMINHAGIVITPGSGFGTWGEGYIRFALTIPSARIHQAVGRLEQMELHKGRLLKWLKKTGD